MLVKLSAVCLVTQLNFYLLKPTYLVAWGPQGRAARVSAMAWLHSSWLTQACSLRVVLSAS